MSDPLKCATAAQFPILNELSEDQIANIATSSRLYRLFSQVGYSDAWIAADVLAWQQLQQRVMCILPIIFEAILTIVIAA